MEDMRAFVRACLHSDLIQAALPVDLCAGIPKALGRDRLWIPFYRVRDMPDGSFTIYPPAACAEVQYPSGEILLFERLSTDGAPFSVTQREGERQMAAAARYLANLELYCAGQTEQDDLQSDWLESVGPLAMYYP